jgi:hypothetical protein
MNPQSRLHLLVPDDGGLRIQAGEGGWGSARAEFWSDPIGHPNEWRPGYIASGDSGGWTGRLDFFTNGAGFGSKTDSVLGMSIRNGKVGIGTDSPQTSLHIDTGPKDIYIGKDSDIGEGSEPFYVPAIFAESVLRVRQRVEIWDDNDGDNYLDIRSGSSQAIKLTPNGDSWLNGGNVGIGTVNPSSTLDVEGDIEIGSGNAFYLGDPESEGSWRITRNGNNLVFQRRESGSWVTKEKMTP